MLVIIKNDYESLSEEAAKVIANRLKEKAEFSNWFGNREHTFGFV